MNRTELQREREQLYDRIAGDKARMAELDAQLARPALPEGWTGAGEKLPRNKRNVEVLLDGWKTAHADDAHLYKRIAWWDAGTAQWRYPTSDDDGGGSVFPRVAGEVACWRDIPADWLSPPAKSAEAEAMVKAKGESTTERMMSIFYGLQFPDDCTRDERMELRARILAADRSGLWEEVGEKHKVDGKWWLAQTRSSTNIFSVTWNATYGRWDVLDPATNITRHAPAHVQLLALADPSQLLIGGGDRSDLWEPIRENHKHGQHYPTKFRRSDGTEYCAVAYWDRDILRWVTADTDLVSDDDAVAVLDPSKLIGGAS